jgi:coenzyme F420 hydrogenase subunit beta
VVDSDWWDKLKIEIIDQGLCTRCGTCVGLSSAHAIEFDDPLGQCLPSLKRAGARENEWIYHGCPGKHVSFPELNDFVFGCQPPDKMLGHAQELYVGYATDPLIRRNAASGGMISAALIHLLENKKVDGAIVLGTSDVEPWRSEPKIVTTPEEVLKAAQSKYTIAPLNTILSEIEDFDGRLAYVGLPCEVHSIRKLQMRDFPGTRKIAYVIGSFCGNTLHFSSVISFLKSRGVRDYREVSSLKYRAGEWPGAMEAVLRDGRVFRLEKFYANYLIPFHIMKRCLLCTDMANEFADVSAGDAWAPVYEERGKGFSLIVCRTPEGVELVNSMASDGLLEIQPIRQEDAVAMHSHGYDLKKRGAFIRMDFAEKRGRAVPDYGYYPGPFTLRRRIFERVLGLLFTVCSWGVSRRLIEIIPPRAIGKVFNAARIFWKKVTRGVKTRGLEDSHR